jgi:glycosyltransferase involved in cell wall biosynthesis
MRRRPEWLDAREADVLHFHWPESFWRRSDSSLRGELGELHALWQFLRRAKRLHIGIVWTVHNIEAHEQSSWMDGLAHRLLVRAADLLICHSSSAAAAVAARYGVRDHIVVMPHGNFEGIFPAPRPRGDVLAEFQLSPSRPLVSCLGNLRGYKGLELAAAAAARSSDEVHLLIAGPPHADYDLGPLKKLLHGCRHATLIERRLTDQEFADLTAASDASVLSYSKVTTSGVLLASWTLGTGVIASDLPPFRELLADAGIAGRLYPSGDAGALAAAMSDYLSAPREVRQTAALAEARRYSWPRCIAPLAPHLERLRQLRASKRRR